MPETDGTIGIVSKVPIPRQLVSVSVSIQAFFESRYQSRYRSRALSIFWKVLAEFLLSKVSVSISVPVQFHGISISLDVDWVWVSVSVSVSIQGPIKYQYRLEISGPVCLWYARENSGHIIKHPAFAVGIVWAVGQNRADQVAGENSRWAAF